MSTGSTIASEDFVNVGLPPTPPPTEPPAARRGGRRRPGTFGSPKLRDPVSASPEHEPLPPVALAGPPATPGNWSAHECGVCGKRFSSANVLASHVRGAHAMPCHGDFEQSSPEESSESSAFVADVADNRFYMCRRDVVLTMCPLMYASHDTA